MKEDLSFNTKHVPVSVAITDNFSNIPTFLVNPNPEDLIKDFIKDLEKRGDVICKAVEKDYSLPHVMKVLCLRV